MPEEATPLSPPPSSGPPSVSGTPPRGQRLRELAGLLLGLAAIGYVVSLVGRGGARLTWPPLGRCLPWLLAALVGAVLARWGSALAWHGLLTRLGAPRSRAFPASLAVGVYTRATLARYLPGGVWHVPGLALLLGRHGIGRTAVLVSLWLESALGIVTGVVLALLYGTTWAAGRGSLVWLLAALGALTALFCMPQWVRRVVGWGPKRFRGLGDMVWPLDAVLRAAPAFLALRLLGGLVLWLLARGLLGGDLSAPGLGLGELVGIEAASWVLAFIVPVIPGGLGLRENMLVAFLAPSVPGSAAAQLALLYRVVLLGGELVAVLAAPLLTPAPGARLAPLEGGSP